MVGICLLWSCANMDIRLVVVSTGSETAAAFASLAYREAPEDDLISQLMVSWSLLIVWVMIKLCGPRRAPVKQPLVVLHDVFLDLI